MIRILSRESSDFNLHEIGLAGIAARGEIVEKTVPVDLWHAFESASPAEFYIHSFGEIDLPRADPDIQSLNAIACDLYLICGACEFGGKCRGFEIFTEGVDTFWSEASASCKFADDESVKTLVSFAGGDGLKFVDVDLASAAAGPIENRGDFFFKEFVAAFLVLDLSGVPVFLHERFDERHDDLGLAWREFAFDNKKRDHLGVGAIGRYIFCGEAA